MEVIVTQRLVTMKEMLAKEKAEKYAVGHFNINSFQWAEAILEAAEKEYSPVILASSDRLVDYLGGFKTIPGGRNELSIAKTI